MTELINGYYIDTDTTCHTLKLDTGTVDKNGKKVFKTCGYYSTFKNAIQACIGFIQKEKLSNGTFTLQEALGILEVDYVRFTELLTKHVKEV